MKSPRRLAKENVYIEKKKYKIFTDINYRTKITFILDWVDSCSSWSWIFFIWLILMQSVFYVVINSKDILGVDVGKGMFGELCFFFYYAFFIPDILLMVRFTNFFMYVFKCYRKKIKIEVEES